MQLIKKSLNRNDIYYTPDWVAKDMVEFFKPSGHILEPCKGKGVFLDYMPSADWCEIEDGRDFFQWSDPVDWIVTNPPYSMLTEFLIHAMSVSKNIVYLLPLNFYFMKGGLIKKTWSYGWIAHIRIYGGGAQVGFPMGNPIGAFHFQKDYRGPTIWSWHDTALPSNNRVQPTGGTVRQNELFPNE